AYTPLYAPSRSYFVDYATSSIVSWNPAALEVGESTPIPSELLAYPGEGIFELNEISPTLLDDGRIFFSVSFYDPTDAFMWPERSSYFLFDPDTNSFEGPSTEPRCAYPLTWGNQTDDGTRFFSVQARFVFPRL